jgi:hypothetical protein
MSAFEFEIRRRRRTGALQVVAASDFKLRRCGAVDARELLQRPNVSLYCVDEPAKQALFVETPPGLDLLQGSFLFLEQYRNARRVFGVSYETLQQIGDERGEWWNDLSLIYSVGRCGSTLVSRMFGRLPECLSLSEPDVFTQLVGLGLTDEEIVQRLRMCTRCVILPGQSKSHLVIKYRSMGIEHAALMSRAFPAAKLLFLYRHVESFIVSAMRAFAYRGSPLWGFSLMYRWPILKSILRWYFAKNYEEQVRFAPFARQFTPSEMVDLGPVGTLTMTWLSAMQRCLALQGASVPLLALRYEDLLASPSDVSREIMKYCHVPEEKIPQTLDAMSEDAQRDSILARRKHRKWQMTDESRQTIEQVLARHETIRTADYQLPNTLRVFPRLHGADSAGDKARHRSAG